MSLWTAITMLVLMRCSPIKATWLGGSRLASNKSLLKDVLVTRQEYHEHGSGWLLKRFSNGKP